MEYKRILALAVLTTLLLAPIVSLAETPTPEPGDETLDLLLGGAYGLRLQIILSLGVDRAIELAYAIRNLTYDLFQWEIDYNITAARVQLMRGDVFLNKSLELKDAAPKRALVFAFLAAVHYSHAPALANPVLGRVIRENLGENNTITEQTVIAVINVSNELREILLDALNYARSIDVNTTLAENLLAKGDERLNNASSLLEAGNVTIAFRYAVSGYRVYVRAYHLLVKMTFAKYIKELVREGFSSVLVIEKIPVAKIAVEKLPVWVREHVKAKIERGEIRNLNETIRELYEKATATRDQVRTREVENLKIAVKKILEEKRVPDEVMKSIEQELEEIIKSLQQEGVRGLELAQRVLQVVRERVSERVKIIIRIPEPPVKRGGT